jgi:hypothetical protein
MRERDGALIGQDETESVLCAFRRGDEVMCV